MFVWVFFGCAVLCCGWGSMRLSLVNTQWLCIAESHVHTTQSGWKTPTKGSYSSLHVVITNSEFWMETSQSAWSVISPGLKVSVAGHWNWPEHHGCPVTGIKDTDEVRWLCRAQRTWKDITHLSHSRSLRCHLARDIEISSVTPPYLWTAFILSCEICQAILSTLCKLF